MTVLMSWRAVLLDKRSVERALLLTLLGVQDKFSNEYLLERGQNDKVE